MKACIAAYGLPTDLTGVVATEPPTITSITPTHGTSAGGTSIVLTGTGFTGATRVEFVYEGTHPSLSFVVDSDTQITATTPAEAIGRLYGVRVTAPGGIAFLEDAFLYEYVATPPVVTSISPNTGDVVGGTSITDLHGTGFVSGCTVTIGGVPATSVSFVSSVKLTCTAPAGSAGAKNVVVTNPDALTSGTSGNGLYTYVAPAISALSADLGDTLGADSIVITGTGFIGATAVKFGTTDAASYVVNSNTQITAVSPAHAAGSISVTVVAPGGTTGGAAYEFWDPSVLTPRAFADGGNYVVGGGQGLWTWRYTSVGATQWSRNTAQAPVDDGSGNPLFVRASSTRLDPAVATMTIVDAWGTGDCTVLVVLDIGSIEVQGTHGGSDDASNGCVVGNTSGYGSLLLGGASANQAIFHYHSGANKSAALVLAATTGRAVLAAKKVDITAGSAEMRITQDGATWVTGSTGVGALTGGSTGTMLLGYTGYLPYYYDGKIKALVLDNKAWSDADVVKFYKWAAARHP